MLTKLGLWIIRILIVIVLLFALMKAKSFFSGSSKQTFFLNKLVFLQKSGNNVSQFFHNFGQTFKEVVWQSEREKANQLNKQITEVESVINQQVMSENALLRSKLNFAQQQDYKVIPAEIIGRNADNWFNFILVNKGAIHGVRPEMAVINEFGLVGYAYQVFPRLTKVLLMIDPHVQISCRVKETDEIGVLRGNLGRNMDFDYIDTDSKINTGNILVTSGYSFLFPRNLPVGKVVRSEIAENGLYKQVKVKPLANFTKLDVVFFVK